MLKLNIDPLLEKKFQEIIRIKFNGHAELDLNEFIKFEEEKVGIKVRASDLPVHHLGGVKGDLSRKEIYKEYLDRIVK